jgi:hypothetical protein
MPDAWLWITATTAGVTVSTPFTYTLYNGYGLQFACTAGAPISIYLGGVSVTETSTLDQSYQRISDWVTEQYAWAATKNVPWLRRNMLLNAVDATFITQTKALATITGETITFSSGSGYAYCISSSTPNIVSGTTYTLSVELSSADKSTIGLRFAPGAGTASFRAVNLTTTPTRYSLVYTADVTATAATVGLDNRSTLGGDTLSGSITVRNWQLEVASSGTSYQPTGASWAATYTSLALAAGYPISLYSDRAGTTATYGPDDQVGVLLDGSEGYALGPELVSNGDFSNGTTGWFAYQGTASTSNGVGRLTATSTDARIGKTTAVTSGKTYKITFSVVSVSSGVLSAGWNTLDANSGLASTTHASCTAGNSYTVVITATTAFISFNFKLVGVSGDYFEIDNLSIKEIPGYHATAPSVAGSPTLRLDGNGKWYLDRDTTDDNLPITWPTVLSESQLGPELASGGSFDSSIGSWVGTNWSWGSGKVTHTTGSTGSFRLENTLTLGKLYNITVTVLDRSAGQVGFSAGQSTPAYYSANGTFTVVATCATDTHIRFTPSSDFNGALDNISVREVTGTNVIYTATGDYTTKDSGLILSGATDYKYPQRPSGDYGRIVMASESKYDAKIIKVLDAKRGRSYQLGPELVTNGTFTTNTTGWDTNANVTPSVSNGEVLLAVGASTAAGITQALALTAGKSYLATATLRRGTADSVSLYVINNAASAVVMAGELVTQTTNRSVSTIFTATETNNRIYCRVAIAGGNANGYFDNVSVREILL